MTAYCIFLRISRKISGSFSPSKSGVDLYAGLKIYHQPSLRQSAEWAVQTVVGWSAMSGIALVCEIWYIHGHCDRVMGVTVWHRRRGEVVAWWYSTMCQSLITVWANVIILSWATSNASCTVFLPDLVYYPGHFSPSVMSIRLRVSILLHCIQRVDSMSINRYSGDHYTEYTVLIGPGWQPQPGYTAAASQYYNLHMQQLYMMAKHSETMHYLPRDLRFSTSGSNFT